MKKGEKMDAADWIAGWLDMCSIDKTIGKPENIGQVLSSKDWRSLKGRIRRAITMAVNSDRKARKRSKR